MACNDPNVRTLISPQIVGEIGFYVESAVRVIAHGLAGDDYITFKKVRYCSDNPHFKRDNCSIFEPSQEHISDAVDYQIGVCSPSLTADRNMVIIPFKGYYLPVLHGNASSDLVVDAEPVEYANFTDKEKGVEPCLPCIPKWQTTGTERCGETHIEQEEINTCTNERRWTLTERQVTWRETGVERCKNHVIEVEEENDCGKKRWTATAKKCGYIPTVPFYVPLNCDETAGVIGYLFSPNEERDPDATVPIEDCDGNVKGYAYPTDGEGHTLAIEDCDGNVTGYCGNPR